MKYALIQVSNGSFSVVSEHGENKQSAFVAFHDRCRILWNASDVIKAVVEVVDDNLDIVEGKRELIEHPEPEPNAE